MKKVGYNRIANRPVYLAKVPDFSSLRELNTPSKHSVLLLLANASSIDSDTVGAAAERLIDCGVVYVCTWGEDCMRVHDIFDEIDVGDGAVEKDYPLMSTWHTEDSLEDVIDFFLGCAFPFDHQYDTTSYVAVIVGEVVEQAMVHSGIRDSEHIVES